MEKNDLKRYSDFASKKVYDLLVVGEVPVPRHQRRHDGGGAPGRPRAGRVDTGGLDIAGIQRISHAGTPRQPESRG
jgi:hypothetical protein